ncbi:MAG TPA: glycosyltransferase family 9 protein, partial [Planctomycetia bacterium]|nr:glycosyltransferase family 9 protein [Planctomycetia bacterium]
TTLRTLAAVLARCELLFTNDSGPMHLAAALGVRTAAIFTCTSPERAGAFGHGHVIAQTTVPCRASYLKKCDRMICMEQLTTDAVLPILDAAWRCPSGGRDSKAA